MKRGGIVYIMTNFTNTTLYTGVTSDIMKRVYEHKNKIYPDSFTAKYQINKLVYYQSFIRIEDAIVIEKKIKSGSRKRKESLINKLNPEWKDLYDEVLSF